MRTSLACALLMPWLLAACSGLFAGRNADLTNPAPPGISFRALNGDVAATAARAQDYCGRYGKTAKQQGTSPAGDSVIVSYDCT